MIQLNLLPDIKLEYLRAQRTKRFFVLTSFMVAAGSIAIVAFLAFIVYVVQGQHASNLQSDIEQNLQALQQKENLPKILTVQNQLEELSQLHSDKPIVSRLFNYFIVVIPDEVSLNEVVLVFGGSSGSDTTIEMTGEGADFKSVNQFADALKNAEFVSTETPEPTRAFNAVTLDTIGKNDEFTTFELRANVNDQIFAADEESLKLTVPEIISSPSVTERPGQIFNRPTQQEEGERQ